MDTIQTGILRILHPKQGNTMGTAFVISNTQVATCAHILENAGLAPGDTVSLIFRHQNCPAKGYIEAEHWHDQTHEDVALLRLNDPLPSGVKVLPLIIARTNIIGHHFHTIGYPDVKPVEGLIGTGTIDGKTTEHGIPVFQLTSDQITHGFSGAPLWDIELHGVVGIVNSIIGTHPHRIKDAAGHSFITTSPADPAWRNQRTAFATTTETLCTLYPSLSFSEASHHPLPSFTNSHTPLSSQRSQQVIEHTSNNAISNTGNAISHTNIQGNQYITYVSLPPPPSQEHTKNRLGESVNQNALDQLIILLQKLQVSKKEVENAYNKCVPEDLTGLNIWLFPNKKDIAQLLYQTFRQLEQVPEANNDIPALLAFVEYISLMSDAERKILFQELREWIDTYINVHKINPEKVTAFQTRNKINDTPTSLATNKNPVARRQNEQYTPSPIYFSPSSQQSAPIYSSTEVSLAPLSLLVKLWHEHGTKKFFVKAWLRDNETAQLTPFPLTPEKETNIFDKSYHFNRIPTLLAHFLTSIADHAEAQKVNIEFFVPCELFDKDFENWNIDNQLPLGMRYQLFIRAAERRRTAYPYWKEKCQILHHHAVIPHSNAIHWIQNTKNYEANISKKIAAYLFPQDIVGMAMAICPSHFTSTTDKKTLFRELVNSGIPVAFWPRCLPTDPLEMNEAQNILLSLEKQGLSKLPDRIQEQRRQAQKSDAYHVGHHLALFWDEWDTRLPTKNLEEPSIRS